MSPKAFSSSQYDDPTPTELAWCQDCQRHHWEGLGHRCDALAPARGIINALICSVVIIACIAGAAWIWTGAAQGKTPKPVAAPSALLKARHACPVDQPLKCRAALRRAYAAVEWQQKQTLELAREMVGNVTAWTCIHNGEGAWNSTGFYHGGLQMDWTFMRSYGRDMLKRHHGAGAEAWTPREQIIVAQRAFIQGRGYAPWPQTSHACGLR